MQAPVKGLPLGVKIEGSSVLGAPLLHSRNCRPLQMACRLNQPKIKAPRIDGLNWWLKPIAAPIGGIPKGFGVLWRIILHQRST